jgi:hypothetical protein
MCHSSWTTPATVGTTAGAGVLLKHDLNEQCASRLYVSGVDWLGRIGIPAEWQVLQIGEPLRRWLHPIRDGPVHLKLIDPNHNFFWNRETAENYFAAGEQASPRECRS